LIVPERLGDAPTIISAHQTLFRLGFSAHLFELVLNILEEIIGFYLFWRVNVIVAAVSLALGLSE